MHQFDRGEEDSILGKNNHFLSLLGFRQSHNKFPISGLSEAIVKEVKDQSEACYKQLNEKGLEIGFECFRRSAIPYGYPTLYAMSGGYAETFAEMTTYVIADPQANQYIREDIFTWLRETILK